MALTMTRTRTQTTLTRLAQLVANIHSELDTVERLTKEHPQHEDALAARKQQLESDRDALYRTLKQFDPALDATSIGTSDQWIKAYGRRGSKTALKRYLTTLSTLVEVT